MHLSWQIMDVTFFFQELIHPIYNIGVQAAYDAVTYFSKLDPIVN